jgi:RNase P subunit RPR2
MFNESLRKARKTHFCHLCRKKIIPGKNYFYQAGVIEGDFQTTKMCMICAATVKHELSEADPGTCIYYGEEREHRRYMIEEYGWRGALARLKDAANKLRNKLSN